MNSEKLRELADEILTEMYAEAEPPLDFMELRENPEQAEDGWYDNHYLPEDEQDSIFEKHLEGYDLSNSERTALVWECIVNLGPASPKEE